MILVGLAANPYSIGFYTTDGSIDSAVTKFAIIMLELIIIVYGFFVLYKKPHNSANISLGLTVFLFFLFLAEMVSVSMNIFIPHDFKERHSFFYEFYCPDRELGFRPKSNLRSYKVSWTGQGVFGVYSTDESGFRNAGRDYSTTDLYFVGDSFTFGSWIDRDKTFYGIIESELKEPVISLGAGGYGFAQYRTLMNTFVQRYHPDTAVLCIFANDLSPLPTESYISDWYRKAGWDRYKVLGYKDKSVFTQVLKVIKRNQNGHIHEANSKELANGLVLYKHRGASPDYIAASEYIEVEKGFLDVIDLAKQSDATLLVSLFPSKESVYKSEYIQLFPGDYLYNEEVGYARICNIAYEQGIECVDLTPIFRGLANKGEKLYFDKDPHWNELGHKIAAEAILPFLTE